MSRKISKQVTFISPDKPTIFNKNSSGTKVGGKKKRVIGIWTFRLPKSSGFSPVRFLRRFGAKVARAFLFISISRSSRKVSSASLARSRSYAEPLDSHRAEALEDCIEFLNSSSSLQRSNSVSTTSC